MELQRAGHNLMTEQQQQQWQYNIVNKRTHCWKRKWQPTPVFLPGESQELEPGGRPSMGSHRVGHN